VRALQPAPLRSRYWRDAASRSGRSSGILLRHAIQQHDSRARDESHTIWILDLVARPRTTATPSKGILLDGTVHGAQRYALCLSATTLGRAQRTFHAESNSGSRHLSQAHRNSGPDTEGHV
jgi:hypothetical protein